MFWIFRLNNFLRYFNLSREIHRELLKKFSMQDVKIIDTPISTNVELYKNDTRSDVNQIMYRGIIVSILYLTANRTDIVCSPWDCVPYFKQL